MELRVRVKIYNVRVNTMRDLAPSSLARVERIHALVIVPTRILEPID